MLRNIRAEILDKLKCALCEGYLSATPIVINAADDSQICGKCYKILPVDERSKCVRQVAYELVAETFLFPCRYDLQGCQSEFPLNGADNHELECPFRFDALTSSDNNGEEERQGLRRSQAIEEIYQDVRVYSNKDVAVECDGGYVVRATSSPSSSLKTLDPSELLIVETKCTVKENPLTQAPTLLKYETEIRGNDAKGCYLHARSARRPIGFAAAATTERPQNISIEGAISLSSFRNVYCKVAVKPASEEPLYDVIWEGPSPSAAPSLFPNRPNCSKCCVLIKDEIYHCTFGHDVCKNCKGGRCARCATPISFVPRYCCENVGRGCRLYLLHSELYLHGKDCEYRTFPCLLRDQEGCGETPHTLAVLKEHVKDKHLTSIILSNLVVKEATEADDFWIMLAFENLFKCKMFHGETEVEFLVEVVGPLRAVENYKFEIHVKTNDNQKVVVTKKGDCVGWNYSPLEPQVIVGVGEMKKAKLDIRRFTYTLNLVKLLKE